MSAVTPGIDATAAQLAFELNGDMGLVGRLLNGNPDAIRLAATLRWTKAEDEILQVHWLIRRSVSCKIVDRFISFLSHSPRILFSCEAHSKNVPVIAIF